MIKEEIELKKGGEVEIPKNIEMLKEVPETLNQVYRSVMQEGTDYGKVPGTSKPTLFKAGAELLARWLNLATEFTIASKVENIDPEHPYFDYTVECRIYSKNAFIGNGWGSCNTREPRYSSRWVYENQVPEGLDKNKLPTRGEGERKQYKIPTPPDEVFGLKNTILKMAEKRAFVDAILRVTGASRIFTQDLESKEEEMEEEALTVTLDDIEYALRDYSDKVNIEETNEAYRVTYKGDVNGFKVVKTILEELGFRLVSVQGDIRVFILKKP